MWNPGQIVEVDVDRTPGSLAPSGVVLSDGRIFFEDQVVEPEAVPCTPREPGWCVDVGGRVGFRLPDGSVVLEDPPGSARRYGSLDQAVEAVAPATGGDRPVARTGHFFPIGESICTHCGAKR